SSDPGVAKHVTSSKFNNLVKGDRFREILEPLGVGVITSGSDEWRARKKVVLNFLYIARWHGEPRDDDFLCDADDHREGHTSAKPGERLPRSTPKIREHMMSKLNRSRISCKN
ncbi:hypothetical protein Taro_036803, partial [Colocasia esculenta]|nr:hypothetical protein [Colocasia esculenta]